MVVLVNVTQDEDIYYDYVLNQYIRCPRTELLRQLNEQLTTKQKT